MRNFLAKRASRVGLTVGSLAVLAGPFLTAAVAATPPPDFSVIAAGGGVRPDLPVSHVVFDMDGIGVYCRTEGPDRATGDCTTTEVVSLTPTQLESIWDQVVLSDFFNLAPFHLSTTISDGTFAQLVITANGQSFAVATQNLAVPAFDAIVAAVNATLPPQQRVIYNALLGP